MSTYSCAYLIDFVRIEEQLSQEEITNMMLRLMGGEHYKLGTVGLRTTVI